MPVPLVIGGVVLAEEAVAALIVWATRILYVGTAATGAVIANQASKPEEEAAPATKSDTTTIVGKGTMNCGDNGKYGDMLNKTGDGKLDRDHVPSKAALQEAAKEILKNNPALAEKLTQESLTALFGDKGLISKQGQTIAIPKKDHQQHSDTYGRRNSPEKIKEDAKDLNKAAEKDTKTIEEAEGKQMDDECAGKYKKAAENIRKKTHAEYVKELTDLIKDVIKNQK